MQVRIFLNKRLFKLIILRDKLLAYSNRIRKLRLKQT